MCSWGPVHRDACQGKETKRDRFPQELSVEWGGGGGAPQHGAPLWPWAARSGGGQRCPTRLADQEETDVSWSVLEALLTKTVSPEPSPPIFNSK